MIQNGRDVTFEGKGAAENNFLRALYIRRSHYIQLSTTFLEKVNLDLTDFKTFVNEYVSWVNTELSTQDFNAEFIKTEKAKANLLAKNSMLHYSYMHGTFMGVDSPLKQYLNSVDPKDENSPEVIRISDSIQKEMDKMKLSEEESTEMSNNALESFTFNNQRMFESFSLGYADLMDFKIQAAALLKFSKYYYALDVEKQNDFLNLIPLEEFKRNVIIDTISNTVIKEALLWRFTAQLIKSAPTKAKDHYDIFIKNNTNPLYSEKIEKIYTAATKLDKGKLSPKFVNYENAAGGTTSLDDLSGSYVYIDVWATWCGPCKKEIPSLKVLEKEYHGKNIKFVSLSVDTEKAHDAWKKMVKDMELSGIQLIADKAFKSDFVSAYLINSIPRFLLIDPEGNIVDENAPRPSSEDIRPLFDKLLQ
ncbi:hypothetical protein C1H87_22035 [Flavivirga eckloniae]|uniref:Thioredoxin domain-containing protein n=2 Tax=Flavivirga eckloniae TaxID=1803846 RepID=A0A2K9PXC0_9FLAO|nr:hypothetical protein C1H87_22035 [Flavivirga eckloniae]